MDVRQELPGQAAATSPPAPDYLVGLTGLRGYAALWVVLSHTSFTDALLYPLGKRLGWRLADGFIRHEHLAVDLFFMLSGFVLTHVHRRDFDAAVLPRDTWRFLCLRLARIYPLHLIALCLTAVAWHFTPDAPTGDVPSFVLQVLLMGSWGFTVGETWNLPGWSLSSEWLAYLVFPLIALATAQVRKPRWQLFGVAALFGLFWFLMTKTPVHRYTFGSGASARVLIGVSIGSLLRRLYDEPLVKRVPWTWVFVLCLPVLWWTVTDLQGHRLPDSVTPVVVLAVMLFATAHVHPNMLLVTGRLPVYLGEISYAIYILHYPVLRTVRWFAGDALKAAVDGPLRRVELLVFSSIALMVVVSAIAHHLIELPVRDWLRKKIDARWPALSADRRAEASR